MKKIALTVAVFTFLILFNSFARAGVVGSPHDFTPSHGGTFVGSSDEVCIYCHTPHNALTAAGQTYPLWNRSFNEKVSFTMYDSPTFDATVPQKPTGSSLLCMSCHDGVSTLGSIGTGPQPDTGGIINYSQASIDVVPTSIDAVSYSPSRDVNIGKDLSNDHPVSFVFDSTLIQNDTQTRGGTPGVDDRLELPPAGSPLKLSDTKLECTTCHDPHEYGDTVSPSKAPFLRMSNAGSEMCIVCHKL